MVRDNHISHIRSIAPMCRQYNTGEQPVLMSCSDGNRYVCKFSQTSGSAYKLVCELIGSLLANSFGLNVSASAIVFIPKEHLREANMRYLSDKVCIGGRFLDNAVDITKISLFAIENDDALLSQLIQIALFDLWTANEDRNFNNYNLMFDIEKSLFVPIDFGCIFNTSTFELPLSQLTCTDSIIYSELFQSLRRSRRFSSEMLSQIKNAFLEKIAGCKEIVNESIGNIPSEWNISQPLVLEKIMELFGEAWINWTWENFLEILNDTENE